MEIGIFLIILDISLKVSPAFQNTEADFELCCTKVVGQQNGVMKYSSSAPVVKQENFTSKYTKISALSKVFFKEFDHNFRTATMKNTASEDNYFLKTFLNGCFSKAAAKIYSF